MIWSTEKWLRYVYTICGCMCKTQSNLKLPRNRHFRSNNYISKVVQCIHWFISAYNKNSQQSITAILSKWPHGKISSFSPILLKHFKQFCNLIHLQFSPCYMDITRFDDLARIAKCRGLAKTVTIPSLLEIIEDHDESLLKHMRDPSHCLPHLLPPVQPNTLGRLRSRGHPYTLPQINFKQHKLSFPTRCLFNNM